MSQQRITQKLRILELLMRNGVKGTTSEDLAKIGGFRYSARINELRKSGYVIQTKNRKGTECCTYLFHGLIQPAQMFLIGLEETARA